VHWQIPGMELHTVNVVEVTAPVLQMAFLDTAVRPLLKNTYSGEHLASMMFVWAWHCRGIVPHL